MEKSPFSILFVSFLLLHLSMAASDSVGTFVQCLSNHSNQARSIVYTPDNSSYQNVLQSYIRNSRFNRSTTPKPLLIATPLDETHVQATVLCATKSRLRLKIRSGGHDFEGISYTSSSEVPFVVLDMFNLRSITVDPKTETGWVQTGATLGELYYKIASASKVHSFPAGVCPTVGIGGHLSGGGYGNMLRKYGLSADNVVDAKIVNVDGRVLDRKGMGEDLFWAIRGGGGASFGVVLSYKIKLVRVPEIVTVFRVEKTLDDNATDLVYRWQYVADKIDGDLFIRVLLQPVSAERNGEKTIKASFISLFLGDSERLMRVMNNEFPELGLKKEDCREMSWIESVLYWANFDNGTSVDVLLNRTWESYFLKRKSDYVQNPIPKDGLEGIWNKMIELGKTGFVFNPYGGKMSEIPAVETPFPHRAGNIFKIQYSVSWKEEGIEEENMYLNQIRTLYNYMTPFVSKSPRGAFLNYRDLDIGNITPNGKYSYNEGKVYGQKYFMGNFDRLVKVKTMVDPGNFFSDEQSIPTSQPTHHRGGTKKTRDGLRLVFQSLYFLVTALFILPR